MTKYFKSGESFFGAKEEKSHLQTTDLFAPNGLSDLETHRKKQNFADDNFQAEDIIIKLKERHARAFLFFNLPADHDHVSNYNL